MGLGEGAGSADAENAGNGIRLMGDEVLHVLIPLEFFFRVGEKAVSGIGEVDALIGADEKGHADFFFHLVEPVGEGRLCHEKPFGYFIDAPFFAEVNQNFPVCIVHGQAPYKKIIFQTS